MTTSTSDGARRAIGYAGLGGVALDWMCEHPLVGERLGWAIDSAAHDLLIVCLIGMILVPILWLPSGRVEIGPVKGESGRVR